MKEKLVSQRLINIYLFLITLVIIALALTIFLSNNVSADTHWWDGGGGDNLWSTDANWNSTAGNDIEPIAADDLYWWGGISTKSCTWDVAVIVGKITITSNYTGTVTQGGVNFGYSDFSYVGGSWVGATGKTQTCSGNFAGKDYNYQALNLIMTGNSKTLSVAAGVQMNFRTLHISGNITTVVQFLFVENTFILDANRVLTINTPGQLLFTESMPSVSPSVFGTIAGTGKLDFKMWNADRSFGNITGNINLPVYVEAHASSAVSAVMSMTSDMTFGSAITVISQSATYTITLNLNGKTLIAESTTASTRGIISSSVAGARIDCPSIIVQTDGHIYGINIAGIIYSDPILTVNNPNLYSYTVTSNLTIKTWSKDSGNATWISVGASNGTVYGTPPSVVYSHPEYFTLNIKLLDFTNDPFYQNYTITVTNPTPPPPEITSIPVLTVQQTFLYSYTLTANQTGGVWNFTSNGTWLSLVGNVLNGTDNNNGSYWVEVTYINVNGTGYQNFTINVTGFVYIPPFTLNDATILGLFFYIMCLVISLIGFRYNMTTLCIVALLVSLLPIVSMLNLFGTYAYILLLFYLPLALIPIATWRK